MCQFNWFLPILIYFECLFECGTHKYKLFAHNFTKMVSIFSWKNNYVRFLRFELRVETFLTFYLDCQYNIIRAETKLLFLLISCMLCICLCLFFVQVTLVVRGKQLIVLVFACRVAFTQYLIAFSIDHLSHSNGIRCPFSDKNSLSTIQMNKSNKFNRKDD